jgi:hypothetical protein
MEIERRSIISRAVTKMDIPVTQEQITRWQKGENIQNVMPELTVQQREFLISGMTLEEQALFFNDPPPEID